MMDRQIEHAAHRCERGASRICKTSSKGEITHSKANSRYICSVHDLAEYASPSSKGRITHNHLSIDIRTCRTETMISY